VLVLVLLGLGGMAGALVLFNRIWKRRFRGVRRELVARSSLGGSAGEGLA